MGDKVALRVERELKDLLDCVVDLNEEGQSEQDKAERREVVHAVVVNGKEHRSRIKEEERHKEQQLQVEGRFTILAPLVRNGTPHDLARHDILVLGLDECLEQVRMFEAIRAFVSPVAIHQMRDAHDEALHIYFGPLPVFLVPGLLPEAARRLIGGSAAQCKPTVVVLEDSHRHACVMRLLDICFVHVERDILVVLATVEAARLEYFCEQDGILFRHLNEESDPVWRLHKWHPARRGHPSEDVREQLAQNLGLVVLQRVV